MEPVRIIKHIVVIQSLPDGDLQTGRDLYDDTIRRRIDLLQKDSIKMTHAFYDVKNKAGFINVLNSINADATKVDGGIVIHFEMHGSDDKKGIVFADRSFLSWLELIELLRPINIVTCNKLFITLATCFGRYLYQGVDPFKKSPYQAYISASKEVKPIEVIEKFNVLFEVLIEQGDLIKAYNEHEKLGSNFYYKDSLTSFELAVERIRERFNTDPEFKNSLLGNFTWFRQTFGEKMGKAFENEIFLKAFNDSIAKHLEAYKFTDCD